MFENYRKRHKVTTGDELMQYSKNHVYDSLLDIELEFFDLNREKWFKHHAGKIALIKGTTVYGFYDNYENALKAGYEYYGVVPFLIKEVLLEDRIEFIF